MNYKKLFNLFDQKLVNIDETMFVFKDDPHKIEHYIGYLPQYELPYWVGHCDIEGGCEFKTAKELFEAASRALRYGGDFFLVHKPEKLAELCACAVNAGLEPKRLQLVRHKADKEVSLILLSCRKGGKSGLIWEEMCLMNADGTPTDAYRKLYHI